MKKTIAVTHDEIIKELKREIGIRKHFYPGWIERGTLTETAALNQQARMIAAFELVNELTPLMNPQQCKLRTIEVEL